VTPYNLLCQLMLYSFYSWQSILKWIKKHASYIIFDTHSDSISEVMTSLTDHYQSHLPS
jgi:hypothetical protein